MKALSVADFWPVSDLFADGVFLAKNAQGFMFEIGGLDGSFFTEEQWRSLHANWRSALRLLPDEELQVVFRKRVEFSAWVEEQLKLAFMSDNSYGRRLLLDRLADQVEKMARDEPKLLSQTIICCFWMPSGVGVDVLRNRRSVIESQLAAFGLHPRALDREGVLREVAVSAQDSQFSPSSASEWPEVHVEAGQIAVNSDVFRALELKKLPEAHSELGMIQAITALPYPMDVSLRLRCRDLRPIVTRLERKRNLLNSQAEGHSSPSPKIDSQKEQIDEVLRTLADHSELIFDMQMVVGVRFAAHLSGFQRQALASILRSGAQMDFCELEETSLHTFDCYLECIPGFRGRNIRTHTVLGSNAIHFLPFFAPAKGDSRPVISFQTRSAGIYGLDPVDTRLANYNWLISGTSGSGKSFFVNSLLAQSAPLEPNIFIVDIGGSYNKLTRFLGGRVFSLEPEQGFAISPFFLPPSEDPTEEAMRRQHILQIFLEMARVDGHLPSIELRHLLHEGLEKLFAEGQLPNHPISRLIDILITKDTDEARRLAMILEPWGGDNFFARFVDNANVVSVDDRILTYDLKGLTEFPDLSRVVQLIVCAGLWAKIRQSQGRQFSWIVLDEVAFSLLKTQPQFVDELVSTLRKYFAAAVIVVQDLEKVTSSLAGSSILQNAQTKALLQQRGDPKNYAEALSLNQVDLWAIQSLRREKGSYSEIFLIRDLERVVIRHVPSKLEYWLATTAPEDNRELSGWIKKADGSFSGRVLNFLEARAGGKV